MTNIRKSSDARIRANKKYADKTYKRIAVNVRQEYLNDINDYAKSQQIDSMSSLFFNALKYCMDNCINLSNGGIKQ